MLQCKRERELIPGHIGTGACLLYGISRVVIGENRTFLGGEAYLKQRGVQVVVLDDPECKALMDEFISEKPELWFVPCSSPPRDLLPPLPKSRRFPEKCAPSLLIRFGCATTRNEDIGVEERVYTKDPQQQPVA